jgi:hypothetical protein
VPAPEHPAADLGETEVGGFGISSADDDLVLGESWMTDAG